MSKLPFVAHPEQTDLLRIFEFVLAGISFISIFIPNLIQFLADIFRSGRDGLGTTQRFLHILLLLGGCFLVTGSFLMFWSIEGWAPALSVSCNELLGYLFTRGLSIFVLLHLEINQQLVGQSQSRCAAATRTCFRFSVQLLNLIMVLCWLIMICIMVWVDNRTYYKISVFLLDGLLMIVLTLGLIIEGRLTLKHMKLMNDSAVFPEPNSHRATATSISLQRVASSSPSRTISVSSPTSPPSQIEIKSFTRFLLLSLLAAILVGAWVISVAVRGFLRYSVDNVDTIDDKFLTDEPLSDLKLRNALVTRVLALSVSLIFTHRMWLSDGVPCLKGSVKKESHVSPHRHHNRHRSDVDLEELADMSPQEEKQAKSKSLFRSFLKKKSSDNAESKHQRNNQLQIDNPPPEVTGGDDEDRSEQSRAYRSARGDDEEADEEESRGGSRGKGLILEVPKAEQDSEIYGQDIDTKEEPFKYDTDTDDDNDVTEVSRNMRKGEKKKMPDYSNAGYEASIVTIHNTPSNAGKIAEKISSSSSLSTRECSTCFVS